MTATETLTEAVEHFAAQVPSLIDTCTSPDATDLAALLADVRGSRERLLDLEREVEGATAKAMLGDNAEGHGVRVERHKTRDRTQWDHEAWRGDARSKVVRGLGLVGAQVLTAAGEVLPGSLIYDAITRVQAVHGSGPPRVKPMRELGMDPDEYCHVEPGSWRIDVTRLADEEKSA